VHCAAPAALVDPAAHATQTAEDVWPASALEVPAAHNEHDTLPMEDHEPAGQVAHVESESALVALLAVPAGHSTHSEWSDEAYSPTVHEVHAVDAEDETWPGAHAEHSAAPDEEPVEEPAVHVSHDDIPVEAANVPNAHGVQTALLAAAVAALEVPRGQPTQAVASALENRPDVQVVHSLARSAEIEPGAHATHDASTEAPAAALNLPAAHATHDEAGRSANVPARHCTQTVEAAVETNPGLQRVQVDEPLVTPVKEPATHVAHCVRPAVSAKRPEAQGSQTSELVAFTIALTLPAAHSTHTL
jgi:hypothetical protein